MAIAQFVLTMAANILHASWRILKLRPLCRLETAYWAKRKRLRELQTLYWQLKSLPESPKRDALMDRLDEMVWQLSGDIIADRISLEEIREEVEAGNFYGAGRFI